MVDADTGLVITNTAAAAAPTQDVLSFDLTGGSGISTDNVDGLYLNIEGANGTSTDVSGIHVNFDPITGSSDDTFIGILVDGITATDAVENGISIGTGWDRGLVIGDGTNYVRFGVGTTTAIDLGGTYQISKAITLSPEYSGTTLSADGSGSTTGTITSDNLLNAGSAGWKNYYQWTSTQASNQDYTIITRITLPQDWAGWETGSCPGSTCALEVAYQTGLAATTNNGVQVQVSHDTDTPGTVMCTIAEAASTSWTSFGCTSTNFTNGVPDWDAAGETAVLRIRLKANSTASSQSRAGDITVRYKAKF